MGLEILGITIAGLGAFVLIIVGLLLFTKINLFGIGPAVRSLGSFLGGLRMVVGIALVLIGFMAGGVAYATSGLTNLGQGVSTGSIIGQDSQPDVTAAAHEVTCKWTKINGVEATINSTAASFTLDSNDNTHYNAYLKNFTSVGGNAINGTLSCTSSRKNIKDGAASTCHVESSSYKSYTSTTDSNTYYILETSTTKSLVPGYPWQQVAYLKDSGTGTSEATTTDDQEKTTLVFAQDEVQQYLGLRFDLVGDTQFNYLRANTDPQEVRVICDGKKVAYVTIVKQSHV